MMSFFILYRKYAVGVMVSLSNHCAAGLSTILRQAQDDTLAQDFITSPAPP